MNYQTIKNQQQTKKVNVSIITSEKKIAWQDYTKQANSLIFIVVLQSEKRKKGVEIFV